MRATTVRGALLLGCALAGAGCTEDAVSDADGSFAEHGERLAQELLIVDTHIDAPYRQQEERVDLAAETERDFDYPKARRGGLDVAFMSIYVPASFQTDGGARELADELIDMVEAMTETHPDRFSLVTSVAAARAAADSPAVGLALGIENGAALESDLANLAHFARRGVRYVTLTHSENNAIADSSYADEPRWEGLSPFGEEVVAEMNRLGMMIDVSHVSDAAFRDVVERTQAPVIASHSSCRHFTPGWERNLHDDGILQLAETGGVIQINFGSGFLLHEAREQSSAYWQARRAYLDAEQIDRDHLRARSWMEQYWQDNERIYADVGDVADHIDHVVALVGIDHVGFGSDFDGVGDTLPVGLKDASGYPNLIAELLRRGYEEDDVAKIAGGNLLRVWEEVERTGRRLREGDDAAAR